MSIHLTGVPDLQTSRGKYCEVIQPVNRFQRAFLCRVNHSSKYSFTYPCNSGIIGHAQFAKQRYTIRRIEANEQMTRCMKFSLLPCQQNCYYPSAAKLQIIESFHHPGINVHASFFIWFVLYMRLQCRINDISKKYLTSAGMFS